MANQTSVHKTIPEYKSECTTEYGPDESMYTFTAEVCMIAQGELFSPFNSTNYARSKNIVWNALRGSCVAKFHHANMSVCGADISGNTCV